MSKFKLRNTILDILLRINDHGGFSHLLIDQEIKKKNISAKDQLLLTEIVYGTMERKMTIDYYLEPFIKNSKKIDSWVLMLLRMSVYQMVYLDKIPPYAVIHEAVEIAKHRGHKGISSFVNGVLRNFQRKGVRSFEEIENNLLRLSIETSHPKWMIERWVKHYGYQITAEMCKANLTKKPISVRVQPLRISRQNAIDKLKSEGFDVKPSLFSNQGIIVRKGNILESDLFLKGMITIQDQSSMLVGEMLDVKPGMKVLDACSAPGGKATHIAEKMENNGVIHAYDLHNKKVRLINQKAEKLQLDIICANQGDARSLNNVHSPNSFDRILVDAPCSGLGVIRSKPDIKYRKKQEDIWQLSKIQLEILNSIATLLKKDGLLVYSTCTVDKEENEEVVKNFLKNNNNFQIDETFFTTLPKMLQNSKGITNFGLQIFPQLNNTDGFFLTRFKKV